MSRLENIYIVMCNGISDIGKGWLTASLIGLAPETTLPIKIDPLLNLAFPEQLGIPISSLCLNNDIKSFIQEGRASSDDFKISEDFKTYKTAGARIYPECNIVAGDLINRFINSPNTYIRPGEVKKRTFADLSLYLAKEISKIVKDKNPKTLIVEIGGTIEDHEVVYIPSAMRFLGHPELLGIIPEIILLTYFEFAESYDVERYRVKTQYIRRGIAQVNQYYYGMPLKACFVRRRNVPESISTEILLSDLKNAAYETQLDPGKMIYIPNVTHNSLGKNLAEITQIIKKTELF